MLYTLLAGRPPFDGGNDLELMKAQLEQTPPPLRGLVDNLPPKVEAAVMRALEKDPTARFQTVRDFARVIDACLADLAPAPASAPVADRRLDAPTASRTAINPALQGVRQLPAASAARSRPAAATTRTALPRWARVGIVSVAVLALASGATALLWTTLSSPTDASSNASAPAPALGDAPTSQTLPSQAPAPAAPDPTLAPPRVAAAPPAPEPATTATLPSPPPILEPAKLRRLTIVRLSIDGQAEAPAAQAFRPGERIRLLVQPSEDSHVYCYLQDETRRILRFYPNRFQPSPFVRASQPLEIPGKMRFELVANSLKATETVACFASDRNLSAELPAAVVGKDFANLPVASLDEVRDAFARSAADTLVEGRFQIDVR